MSSRSTIADSPDSHIYSECNESRYSIMGKFIGYDIHFCIGNDDLVGFSMEGHHLKMELSAEGISKKIGRKIQLFTPDLEGVYFNTRDGVEIIIRGGTHTEEKLRNEDFSYIADIEIQKVIG